MSNWCRSAHRDGREIAFVDGGCKNLSAYRIAVSMPRIFFEGRDKHGKYLDFLELPFDGECLFDGRGGVAGPRGLYEKSELVTDVEGVL